MINSNGINQMRILILKAFFFVLLLNLVGCVTIPTVPRSTYYFDRLEKAVFTAKGVVKQIDADFFLVERNREYILNGGNFTNYIDRDIEVLGELYRGYYKGMRIKIIKVKELQLSTKGLQ